MEIPDDKKNIEGNCAVYDEFLKIIYNVDNGLANAVQSIQENAHLIGFLFGDQIAISYANPTN